MMQDRIHHLGLLRRIALPMLKATAIDLTIQHHWLPAAKMSLNSFRHKGYWYHGRSREAETMRLFSELIRNGDNVVEVGGHIGYISLFLSHLAGPKGRLDVFEPGSNNLPYIRKNISRYVTTSNRIINLIECAVGPESGLANLYEDDLTGQNNSLVRDFETLQNNARAAHTNAEVSVREIEIRTLDHHVRNQKVDFVKIDVEGFEWGVLQGMVQILNTQRPIIMVELTHSIAEIHDLLRRNGYRFFKPTRHEVDRVTELKDNTFALHRDAHSVAIADHFHGS